MLNVKIMLNPNSSVQQHTQITACTTYFLKSDITQCYSDPEDTKHPKPHQHYPFQEHLC